MKAEVTVYTTEFLKWALDSFFSDDSPFTSPEFIEDVEAIYKDMVGEKCIKKVEVEIHIMSLHTYIHCEELNIDMEIFDWNDLEKFGFLSFRRL